MSGRRRFLPDGLAGRIILLLVLAIISANVLALAVMAVQKQRFTERAAEHREVDRLTALIPALEAVDEQTQRAIARDASTRFARIRVESKPLVAQTAQDMRSTELAGLISDELGRSDIAVGPISRRQWDGGMPLRSRRTPPIAISVPLQTRDGYATWLNVATLSAPPWRDNADGPLFMTLLATSLLAVLLVAIVIGRHLTTPLRHLSTAARAAGRGDRAARVPETGPREMREAAHAFNKMQSEIGAFDAERVRMLAAVGHDLRTPMTSLRIRAEMVDDPEQQEAMIRALDEMTVMADGLVTYAREGQEAEAPTTFDLSRALDQLCADRGAQCDLAPGVEITARRVSLGRAIGNLIDNAKRYGERARLTLTTTAQSITITVDDDGPGIPEDRLEDMFQPFTRGDNSRSLETGGSGLGLSIARAIITAHGGEITLENRAGGGLRVVVTLPRGGVA